MNDGLLTVLEQNRARLLRYFAAHGEPQAAEDLLQELRLKLLSAPSGPVAAPVNYLFRAATHLVIDRKRSIAQARRRDHAWSDLADRQADGEATTPGAERQIDSRRTLAIVEQALTALPPRARTVLHRHRIEGETQRRIAADLGISQSTVESDLRDAYRLLHRIREQLDEE